MTTYKIETSESYIGTGTVIYFIDKDGDKHEVIVCAKDAFSLGTFLRESAIMTEPDESKFQDIQIIKQP
jgi:hypothetical protein